MAKNSKAVQVGKWNIALVEDDDGMLEVAIRHEDETNVIPTDTDKWDDPAWGERFTTRGLEVAYLAGLGGQKR